MEKDKNRNEFFNKLKDIKAITTMELRIDNKDSRKHLSVTVSKMRCANNEADVILKMLQNQGWYQWTFNLIS